MDGKKGRGFELVNILPNWALYFEIGGYMIKSVDILHPTIAKYAKNKQLYA